MRICLDTNVLIWAIRQTADRSRLEMLDTARRAVERMVRRNAEIAIPTVVLCEYLAEADSQTRLSEESKLRERFMILNFDGRAASEAATLRRITRLAPSEAAGGRNAIKADAMIIACAITHKCNFILTDNTDEFRRIAKDRIPIQDLKQFVESPNSSLMPSGERQLGIAFPDDDEESLSYS